MRCIDLFCGCGGLSLGLENAGFEIVAGIDSWDFAIDNYKNNFMHDAILHDLSNVELTCEILKKYKFDIIVGGPPCQDFSSAGKRNEEGGRADLTTAFAEIIYKIKPKWFLMENVEPIKRSKTLSKLIIKLSYKYGLSSVILDASYCGVPQARTRFFLVGQLGGKNNALNHDFKKNLSTKKMTMRDYFNETLGTEFYYRHPRNYNRRGIFSIDEPSPTIRGVNRPIPKGYKINNCDSKVSSLNEVRPLTTKERSYVQTFPPSFNFHGSKTNLEQLIGNAVPVNLAEYVGRAIKDFEKGGNLFKSEDLFNDDFILQTKALRP